MKNKKRDMFLMSFKCVDIRNPATGNKWWWTQPPDIRNLDMIDEAAEIDEMALFRYSTMYSTWLWSLSEEKWGESLRYPHLLSGGAFQGLA